MMMSSTLAGLVAPLADLVAKAGLEKDAIAKVGRCCATSYPQTSCCTLPRCEFLPLCQLSFQLITPPINNFSFHFTTLHYTSPHNTSLHCTSSSLAGAGNRDQSAGPVGGGSGGGV